MTAYINNWIRIAIEAAHIGGEVLLKYFGKVDANTIETKRVGDWVSEADKASEQAIIDFLTREVPTHDILTEEAGSIHRVSKGKCRWIIDPLDGTTNFLRGFPIWAVSVALEDRSDPALKWGPIIAGAIHIPYLNETFWASTGSGAFRNGKRIRVGSAKPFNECLLGTGFPFRTRHLVGKYVELLGEILEKSADARRPGAVAVDLCYVAAGIFDGFWELDLAPWDIAAGSLIIREAGGIVGDFQGENDFLTTGDIVAGHQGLYSELLGIVKKYFPEKRDVDKSSEFKI